MQSTTLSGVVLMGQGGCGSFSLTTPNPAPPMGPTGGDAGVPDLMVPITNPGDGNNAEAAEPLPGHLEQGGPAPVATPAPSAAEMTTGGPHTSTSQYSTQGPIPKG